MLKRRALCVILSVFLVLIIAQSAYYIITASERGQWEMVTVGLVFDWMCITAVILLILESMKEGE